MVRANAAPGTMQKSNATKRYVLQDGKVGYRDVTKSEAEIEAEEIQRDQEIDYSFASVLQRSKNKEWTFLPHGCVSSHEMWRIDTLKLGASELSECTLWYPTEEALLADLWVLLVETPLDPCIVSM